MDTPIWVTIVVAVISAAVGYFGNELTSRRQRDQAREQSDRDWLEKAATLCRSRDPKEREHGLGFLRALRFLRVLHSCRLAISLGGDFPFFRRNEEVIIAAAQLLVFVFIMTGLVFETQIGRNDHIRNYGDALYFTVTTLTTTGFGDITLPGTGGRMLSVTIMIFGVTLFLRLAQALFRPAKVTFECPTCALSRHEPDAVHCKACGTVLRIPDEGRD